MISIKSAAIAIVATITLSQAAFAEFRKCSAEFEDSAEQVASKSVSTEATSAARTPPVSARELELAEFFSIMNKLKNLSPDQRTQFYLDQIQALSVPTAKRLLTYSLGPMARLIFSPEQMAQIFKFLNSSSAYKGNTLDNYSGGYLQWMDKSLTLDHFKEIDSALEYNGFVANHLTGLTRVYPMELLLTTEDIVAVWERVKNPHPNIIIGGLEALEDFIDRKGHSYAISESQLARLNAVHSRLLKK